MKVVTKEPREIVATELLEGGAPQAQASVPPQTAAREPLRVELVKTVAAEPLESAAIEPLSVVANEPWKDGVATEPPEAGELRLNAATVPLMIAALEPQKNAAPEPPKHDLDQNEAIQAAASEPQRHAAIELLNTVAVEPLKDDEFMAMVPPGLDCRLQHHDDDSTRPALSCTLAS